MQCFQTTMYSNNWFVFISNGCKHHNIFLITHYMLQLRNHSFARLKTFYVSSSDFI